MMYLTDFPNLSSLNLETHSGETETLGVEISLAQGWRKLDRVFETSGHVGLMVQECLDIPGFTLARL